MLYAHLLFMAHTTALASLTCVQVAASMGSVIPCEVSHNAHLMADASLVCCLGGSGTGPLLGGHMQRRCCFMGLECYSISEPLQLACDGLFCSCVVFRWQQLGHCWKGDKPRRCCLQGWNATPYQISHNLFMMAYAVLVWLSGSSGTGPLLGGDKQRRCRCMGLERCWSAGSGPQPEGASCVLPYSGQHSCLCFRGTGVALF